MNTLRNAVKYTNKIEAQANTLASWGEEERKDWFFRAEIILLSLSIKTIAIHEAYGCLGCGVREDLIKVANADKDVLAAAYAKVEAEKHTLTGEELPF